MSKLERLKNTLCFSFCEKIDISLDGESFRVSMPSYARDGDHATIYLYDRGAGWKLSDRGSTLMRLSYENDIDKILDGNRGDIFKTILSESGLTHNNGELYLETSKSDLIQGLFNIAQGLNRVEDLGLWSKARSTNTFYDDLRELIFKHVDPELITENFLIKDLPESQNYPVDYFIKTKNIPLYLFGVGNKDKARLTTIVLQHLTDNAQAFESMVFCSGLDDVPKVDMSRLMYAANDVLPGIGNIHAIERKLKQKLH